MSVLPILTWPDPRLAQVCDPVQEITQEIEQLAHDMLETMYAAPGRGLAAPQVGKLLRLFVMDTDWKEGAKAPFVCINPEVTARSEETALYTEGCLSIPGVSAEVRRPARIRLQWTGLDGARQEQSFEGFAAVCVQHEMDHLEGIVTLDHLEQSAREELIAAFEMQ